MRVVIAGGGTGGHVIPALAIARELRERHQAELQFVGTGRGIETRLVPAAGYDLKLIEVGALKNVSIATRLSTLFVLPRAVLDAMKVVREFKADVVIGVGGYASGPAMLAAILLGVPRIAFEPNVVPGFANRVVAKFVSAAAVHFEDSRRYFRNPHLTGVPVRVGFFQIPEKPIGAERTLLVFGGSQGSRALNRAMTDALPWLAKVPSLRILHQTGEREYNAVQAAYSQAQVSAEVSPFIENMADAFARADLVLCRSGASTVAEIAAAGKAAIFVPFPQAADDHQRRNAEALVNAGAGAMIPEAELTTERLIATVSDLLNQPQHLTEMGRAARALSHPEAAKQIAELAVSVIQKKDSPRRH
jgi:UDP-N-acetylglucosamine--N-acetylmuramyl-(pentapeptide) pyrophosphoryl-undecaprenol N-acetylglucosamine transferase